jgi:hypothetical protein
MQKKNEAKVLGLIVEMPGGDRSVSLGVLLRQVALLIALARLHPQPLANRGWAASKTDSLALALDRLGMRAGQQAEARAALGRSSRATQRLVEQIHRLRGRLVTSIQAARTAGLIPDQTTAAFRALVVTRKAHQVLAWARQVQEGVRRLDATLSPTFLPEKPSLDLAELAAQLEAASAAQGLAADAARTQTVEARKARAEVTALVKQLGLIAALTFEHEPEIAAAFRKRRLPSREAANDEEKRPTVAA